MPNVSVPVALKYVADFYDLDYDDLLKVVKIAHERSSTLQPQPKPMQQTEDPPACKAYVNKKNVKCKRPPNAACSGFCKIHFTMISSNRLKYGFA